MSQERGSHPTAGKKQLSTHAPCSPERSKVTASTPALDFWKGKKETHLNSDSAQFCRLSSSQLFQDSFLSPLERSQRCERQCVCWGRGCFEAFLAFHCPPGLFILCFVKLYWTWIWNPLPFYLFAFFFYFVVWWEIIFKQVVFKIKTMFAQAETTEKSRVAYARVIEWLILLK